MSKYINADELFKTLRHEAAGSAGTSYLWGYRDGVRCAMDEIRHAPTVDVEPVKHGHWEHIGHVLGRDDLFCGICSECEKTTVSFETAPERCSHCGAKMDEKVPE